jgi:hypothetical protein
MSHPPELPPNGPGPYGGYGPGGYPGYTPPGYGPPGFGGPPPKRSGLPTIVLAIAGVMAAFFMLAIWQFLDNEDAPNSVVFADDKSCQIEVPPRWLPHPELKKNADRVVLRLADPRRNEYLIVTTALKKDYQAALTTHDFADLWFEESEKEGKLKDATVSEPVKLEIGGRPAFQYTLSGSTEGKNLGYLVTFVEGPKAFHEIINWTLKSEFAAKQPGFAKVASTFKED